MVNEHYLPRLVEQFSIVYSFYLRLSFICGLPAPTRPSAWSQKVEVGLETFFIRSTHPADEGSFVFRAAGCGSVPEAGCRSSE
jgi:hypothetical protein